MHINAFAFHRLPLLALLGALIWAPGAALLAQTNASTAQQGARAPDEGTLLTDKDTIVLADFDNKTEEPVFDDALKQALALALEQSPFLNVLSGRKVSEALRTMGHPATERITPEVGRELCLRTGSKAVIGGAISNLRGRYLLEVTAVACSSGNTLANEQGEAENKEDALKALSPASSSLRTSLGESRASVQTFDVPIETSTHSIEAIKWHRRVPYAIQGSVHIPGRFAIDWIKVDKKGKYFDGDGSHARDWYGYGAEVLAATDGVMAATRDRMPESATLVKSPVRVEPEDASGNYVSLNLGAGHFAFYEHLKPGSIRVKPRDHVRRGSVIGLLGFTGESTGPHLHFHVSDFDSPLNAEGPPYQLERFITLGSYPSIEAFGKSQPWSSALSAPDANPSGQFPAPLSVVNFLD